MTKIEMTKEPVNGFSGSKHFGVPDDSELEVSRLSGNNYGDRRPFVSVEFKGYGLSFIFDRDDVEEAWKDKPDMTVLRDQVVQAICVRMSPKVFGDILTAIRYVRFNALEQGAEDLRHDIRVLLRI